MAEKRQPLSFTLLHGYIRRRISKIDESLALLPMVNLVNVAPRLAQQKRMQAASQSTPCLDSLTPVTMCRFAVSLSRDQWYK